ncbi:MAG: copper homeostasis protein CutC, partial [Marinirhabdus sp.]|nr:copper homeostasis protein CutC [Marinirhabdus sp.]
DIKFCEGLGCAGIVSGALTAENAVDRETTSALIAASGALEFTFHRAFDWCPDPLDALEKLKSIQVTRLLTSGQETTAEDGIPLLIELKELAKSQLQIMPGGGISIENCMHFKNAGFNMVHLSATKKTQSLSTIPRVSMHAPKLFEEGIIATSDASIISAVVKKLKR